MPKAKRQDNPSNCICKHMFERHLEKLLGGVFRKTSDQMEIKHFCFLLQYKLVDLHTDHQA